MKKFIIWFKGIVFYTTVMVTVFTALSIDALYDMGLLPYMGVAVFLLISLCIAILSERDFLILTGNSKGLPKNS